MTSVFEILSLWQWAVGAAGLAGAVAAGALIVFGGPWLAAMIGKTAAEVVYEFLKTRLGLAIVVGFVGVTVAYTAGSLHTAHVAAQVCTAQIAKMKADAEKFAELRDATIREAFEAQFALEITARTKREADRDQKEKDLEKEIVALTDKARCELGTAPLRLRDQSKTKPGSATGPAARRPLGPLDLRKTAGPEKPPASAGK